MPPLSVPTKSPWNFIAKSPWVWGATFHAGIWLQGWRQSAQIGHFLWFQHSKRNVYACMWGSGGGLFYGLSDFRIHLNGRSRKRGILRDILYKRIVWDTIHIMYCLHISTYNYICISTLSLISTTLIYRNKCIPYQEIDHLYILFTSSSGSIPFIQWIRWLRNPLIPILNPCPRVRVSKYRRKRTNECIKWNCEIFASWTRWTLVDYMNIRIIELKTIFIITNVQWTNREIE